MRVKPVGCGWETVGDPEAAVTKPLQPQRWRWEDLVVPDNYCWRVTTTPSPSSASLIGPQKQFRNVCSAILIFVDLSESRLEVFYCFAIVFTQSV